jgi:hypothetical protein
MPTAACSWLAPSKIGADTPVAPSIEPLLLAQPSARMRRSACCKAVRLVMV